MKITMLNFGFIFHINNEIEFLETIEQIAKACWDYWRKLEYILAFSYVKVLTIAFVQKITSDNKRK